MEAQDSHGPVGVRGHREPHHCTCRRWLSHVGSRSGTGKMGKRSANRIKKWWSARRSKNSFKWLKPRKGTTTSRERSWVTTPRREWVPLADHWNIAICESFEFNISKTANFTAGARLKWKCYGRGYEIIGSFISSSSANSLLRVNTPHKWVRFVGGQPENVKKCTGIVVEKQIWS